jgi:aminopeptidase YwaD
MRAGFLAIIFFCNILYCEANDTVYARQVIKYLTSKKCFGRGYVKNGLKNAEKFIVGQIRKENTKPFFSGKYTQEFIHPVNTFPTDCRVTINGRQLITGLDFIPDPSSCSLKGRFNLVKADSLHYMAVTSYQKISVNLKRKLTFSVSHNVSEHAGIDVDMKNFSEEPKVIEVNIRNKHIRNFKSRNIGCYIDGNSSDSIIVFSAHYDHLGGIGKVFFPGANDNASGVSVLLNLIRHYTINPPKYKTVFIFFAGEEAGLIGSKFFTENKSIELDKIKFLVNLDLLGTGDDGIMVVNGAVHEKQFANLNEINTQKGLVKTVRKRGKAANSDHYWFSEAGVPAFFIYTMGGIKAYHDIFDVEKTLPLTDYVDVFNLVTEFITRL